MKHLGDITKINWLEAEPVDVVTGGSPCQDLSVAGKRAGLAGERSGLYMEQIRCVKELRQADVQRGRTGVAIRPRFMVWENVPGAFSSGSPKGADFAAVIEEIIKVAEPGAVVHVCVPDRGWNKSGCYYAEDGSWSIAWRVHDAQFWGVPQRRKRISLVADFGGLAAPEVLFERKGLSGDFESSGEKRKGVARDAESGSGTADCGRISDVIPINTMIATRHKQLGRGTGFGLGKTGDAQFTISAGHEHAVCYALDQQGGKGGANYAEEVMPTLCSDSHGTPHAVAYPSGNGLDIYNLATTGDVAASLTTETGRGAPNTGPSAMVPCTDMVLDDQGGQQINVRYDGKSPTLRAEMHGNVPCVLESAGFKDRAGAQAGSIGYQEECAPSLKAGESGTNRTPTVFDARGNGDGKTVCTLTGDHQNRVADYTALCVENLRDGRDVAGALMARDYKGVGRDDCLDRSIYTVDCRNGYENEELSGTIQAKENGGQSLNYINPVRCANIVRRLTPLECERLQGYPDGWTDIGGWEDSKGKKHKEADSPRYKALGNSIAMPFWCWLAKRISAQYERDITIGSLFDGIGGFPYAFEKCGGKAVWASEIEEFPIAVTKIRFPE